MIRENTDMLKDCKASAILSSDGKHRFRLDRSVSSSGPSYAFIGVNPSTADATVDDATVRKWIGFVRRWGGAKFAVVNLFSLRATDVRELAKNDEVNVPIKSDVHLTAALRSADIIIPCWGNASKIPKQHRKRARLISEYVKTFDVPVMCFGFTKSGDPKHPLMLSYDTALVSFAASPAPREGGV